MMDHFGLCGWVGCAQNMQGRKGRGHHTVYHTAQVNIQCGIRVRVIDQGDVFY